MTGLTHATGINFAGNSGWSFGFNSDIGTLEDISTGAETDRMAMGVQVGFGSDALQFSSAVEYRDDDVQQLDLGPPLRPLRVLEAAGVRMGGRGAGITVVRAVGVPAAGHRQIAASHSSAREASLSQRSLKTD